ncbi:MAG: hypothetical protein KAJ18_08065 [Candidatus Omnitrophica bacterium]|nr:hypothetical protein [Candidatus Omnitrophota bacterium]
MSRHKLNDADLKEMRDTVVLLHGVFPKSFFDRLKKQKPECVFVLEGRPSLEAGKSSCRELLKRGITPTVISDNMAGFLFYKSLVKEVWVACQAVDDRGIVASVGVSILGALVRKHGVPMYGYFSPDKRKQSQDFVGKEKDILCFEGARIAPKGTSAYVPLVEWIPISYIRKVYE